MSVTYVHNLDRLHAGVRFCWLLQVNLGAEHDKRVGPAEACRVEHRMRGQHGSRRRSRDDWRVLPPIPPVKGMSGRSIRQRCITRRSRPRRRGLSRGAPPRCMTRQASAADGRLSRHAPANHPPIPPLNGPLTFGPEKPAATPRAAAAGTRAPRPRAAPPAARDCACGAGCAGRWRGLAHEPLERGDDRCSLLGRGVGRDDRELGAAVRPRGEGIVPQP